MSVHYNIFSNSGKVIGYVSRGVLRKNVKGSVHFLKKPPAIAIDIGALKDAENAGATRVEVYDKETQRLYSAFISTIWQHGFQFNRGHGEQVALNLPFWQVN